MDGTPFRDLPLWARIGIVVFVSVWTVAALAIAGFVSPL